MVSADKPSRAAPGGPVPDVIARDLAVMFCGVNPGLRSAAVGHHFARPGNRFWKLLYLAGFTDRILVPEDERLLLTYGLGVTNLVRRPTRSADEVSPEELQAGAKSLVAKIRHWKPQNVAILGIGAYRAAFADASALPGLQRRRLASCRVWVLANPSGRQAHYRLEHMVDQMRELKCSLPGDVGQVVASSQRGDGNGSDRSATLTLLRVVK